VGGGMRAVVTWVDGWSHDPRENFGVRISRRWAETWRGSTAPLHQTLLYTHPPLLSMESSLKLSTIGGESGASN
jgi:hypothetical protein